MTTVTTLGPVPGLEIIPAGECDQVTTSELFDQRLPGLLTSSKQLYGVVILDIAPVLVAPESIVVCKNADGVVLSVMRDVSRIPTVLAGYQRLLSVHANVLGAIVTGDAARQHYGY